MEMKSIVTTFLYTLVPIGIKIGWESELKGEMQKRDE